MKNVLLISFLILFSTTTSVRISTKKQDVLKLIGTSIALNGNFTWIEFNGETFVWTREGERIDDYVDVSVERVNIKLEMNGRVVKLILQPENA